MLLNVTRTALWFGTLLFGLTMSLHCAAVEIPITDDESQPLVDFNGQLGYDFWSLRPSVPKDTSPSRRENSLLFLPNAYTKWPYRDSAPWFRVSGNVRASANSNVLVKAQANQNTGTSVDELSLDTAISPSLGWRAGLVDIKMSWCRGYEPDSPWIQEIDVFCSTSLTKVLNGGAPGAQAYAKRDIGPYQVQAILGVYNPLLFNYADKEFGNYQPPGPYTVTSNRKIGASASALNLDSGSEFRLSWLQATQVADQTDSSVYQQASTSIFWGANFPLSSYWALRLSGNFYGSQVRIHDDLPAEDSVDGARTNNTYSNQVVELTRQIGAADSLTLGYSRYQFRITLEDDPVRLANYGVDADNYFRLTRVAIAATWRRDWSRHFFHATQLSFVEQTSGYNNIVTSSHGYAFGLRTGFVF